jgi:peptidoglycan/LPS O-acetylase OafA/YrhL
MTASPAPAAAKYVAVLDPLRGFAALAVAAFHFTNNGWLPAAHWLTKLGFHGHHGVQTFLVISGFVVPYAMWLGGYSVRNLAPFMARRFVRIYPPYLASAVLIAAMNFFKPASSPPSLSPLDLASHLVLSNELLRRPWLMDIYWTLALEVQFYLLAALVWPLLVSRRSWIFPLTALAAVAIGLVWNRDHCLPRLIEYFLLGIALFRQHAGIDKPLTSAALISACAGMIWWKDGSFALVAASLPVLAKFAIHTVPKPARFLGKISYSLYLFHLLAGAAFLSALAPYVITPASRCWLIAPALAISIVAAWLAHRCIESPAIRWSKSFPYRS